MRKQERKKIDDFEMWCWSRILYSPWTARVTKAFVLEQPALPSWLEAFVAKHDYHIWRQSCQVEHVKFLESWSSRVVTNYPHHHMVAPLNGANSASGAIFRTTKYTVYWNVIMTQSSSWRRQALISGPCEHHFPDSHQNPLGFTPKACFLQKKIRSIRFPNFRENL